MNKSVFLILGVAAGAAAAYLYLNAPASTRLPNTFGDAEDALGKATRWGTGQRVTGSGTQALGKVKQGIGEAVGDDQLANAGALDQAKGVVKDVAGQAAHLAVDAVREFNR